MEAITAPGQYAPAALAAATLQSLLTLGIATAAYITGPAEDPPNLLYTPRLYGDIEVSQSGVDAFGIGGRVALGVADIARFLGRRPVVPGPGRIRHRGRSRCHDPRGRCRRSPRLRFRHLHRLRAHRFPRHPATRRPQRRIARPADHHGRPERLAVSLQPALFAGTGGLEGRRR